MSAKPQLTFQADRRYARGNGREVSDTDGLRGLLVLCRRDDELPKDEPGIATVEQMSLRELLRGKILDSYIAKDPARRLQLYGVLTLYVYQGSAARTARILKAERKERRIRELAEDYLAHAVDWLSDEEERRLRRDSRVQRELELRRLQCEQSCGRKAWDCSGGGSGAFGGCRDCPLMAPL